jgi:hypothetical protein
MQKLIKTLIILCLLLSISSSRLSFKSKGVGSFLSNIGKKTKIFAEKVALNIVRGFLWGLRALDYVYEPYYLISGAHEVSKSFTYTPLIISLIFGEKKSPPLETNAIIRYILFFPLTIIVGIINLITFFTQELLNKAKIALLDSITKYDDLEIALKEFKAVEDKINEAKNKEVERLEKIVEERQENK